MNFHLDIVVEGRLTDPVAQKYDAVIRRGGFLHQDMIARRLSADERMILAAAPVWLQGRGPCGTHAISRVKGS